MDDWPGRYTAMRTGGCMRERREREREKGKWIRYVYARIQAHHALILVKNMYMHNQ